MRYLTAAILFILLSSCSRPASNVRKVLRFAGENRPQLEAVLAHYEDSGEPLKYEAAKYLIGNMGGNAAMDGPSLDRYYRLLDGFYSRPDIDIFALREFNDSLFASPFFTDLKPVFDARTLDSAYLVSHIDRAFEAWESPWAKDLDFNEFCEFLLPYRIGTEIIEDWRTDYRNHYAPYLDSLARRSDAPLGEFCEALNSACVEPHLYENYPGGKPSLKPSVLKRIVGGSCDDYVGLFTYAARTFGVPVAIDFTPQWGNHSQGHKWCATIENDTTYVFDIGDILRPAASNPFTYRLVKAYRKSWAYQSGSPAGHEAPPSLSDQRLVDVTAMYCPVVDIDIRDLQKPLRSRMVWLCAFDDRQWVPVCGSRREGRKVTFADMGYPAVFLPQYYENGELSPAGWPVLVDSLGRVSELKPDSSRPESVKLLRKFMDTKAVKFASYMLGGRFELSRHPDFRDALVMELPDSVGWNFQTLHLPEDAGSFRYVRYVPAPGTAGNIAEIEAYDKDGKRVEGSISGTYDSGDEMHSMDKAFDGETLTYALCGTEQPNPWIGLDLGSELPLSRICFLPRSDDNFIREGELYELCFWDGRWVSLGTRTGSRQTQELIYDNVPSNALLLLHNLTKGKEERIFTYENGMQVWW